MVGSAAQFIDSVGFGCGTGSDCGDCYHLVVIVYPPDGLVYFRVAGVVVVAFVFGVGFRGVV